jgi:hypothetical protein
MRVRVQRIREMNSSSGGGKAETTLDSSSIDIRPLLIKRCQLDADAPS